MRINSKVADETHIRLSLSLLGDILNTDLLIQNQIVEFQNVREQPTYADFKIMRCILDDPRMEISDIAEKISMSSKTVARRLEKMIENHVLDFTIQCNFTAIWGYIVSVVSANIEKGSYRKVLERSHEDLKAKL